LVPRMYTADMSATNTPPGGPCHLPHTTIEKLLARASGNAEVEPGDFVVCEVDRTVFVEFCFRKDLGWRRPLRIADPSRVAIIFDHAVPAMSVADANAGTEARRFAAHFGIADLVDVGAHGISHAIIAERGWAHPGELLIGADSHTAGAGAFNCAARGVGPLELLDALCTGYTWFVVPETVRYVLDKELPPWVSAKDLFLHIAASFGSVAENRAIEFCGEGLTTLPMHSRRTLAIQGVELMSDFTLMPEDAVTRASLAEAGVPESDYSGAWSDPDAKVAFSQHLDLSSLEPYVSGPHQVVGNAVPVSALERTPVNQCFIGSCANGQIEDIALAAAVLEGRKIASGVRLLVTPASQAVAREAARRGFVDTLIDAGAVVTNSTCAPCWGYAMGVVGDDEVCLTASTRNFRGRMGSPSAKVMLASPATVAASAIAGYVVDPRSVVGA
jgi:3-isopropylmalate/(R)-2-methylmalate dehydratase large subunit